MNSTIQSLAAGKNAADRKRVRSHVMAQRNRKKRQEEVERYQNLKKKSTVLLRPAPVPSSSSSSTASQNPADAGHLPSTISDERAGSRSLPSETSIKPGTPVSLASRKRTISQSRKRNAEPRGTGRPGRNVGTLAIKKEPDYVSNFNADATSTNEEADDFRLVKREESFTPSPLARIPPWSYVGQGSTDPFAAMATQVTDRMRGYIHYCRPLTPMRLYSCSLP